MIDFFAAIQTKFDDSTEQAAIDLRALLTSFKYGKGDQGGLLPYGVYFGGESLPDNVFRGSIDIVPVQMNFYSDYKRSASQCFQALRLAKDLFNNTILPVDNHYNILLSKIMEVPPKNIDDIRWMAVIEFNCLLQKREV